MYRSLHVLGLLTLLAWSNGDGRRSAATISLGSYCNGSDLIDDTSCIAKWVAAGNASPGSLLFAPAGTYLYHDGDLMYSGMHVRCASPKSVTFKNIGGNGSLFWSEKPVHDVRIDNCGFDVNGNPANFLAVIWINFASSEFAQNIRVTNNRIRDGTIPGLTSANQRQYITLLNCSDCSAEKNHLSEGGRIKMGRPGRSLRIKGNRVEEANDNAITVVDVGGGTSEDISISDNVIVSPKAVGIFFGADGESQTAPSLTTRRVRVYNNQIRGDWTTACILGTLPANASDIRVNHNTCLKTGTAGPYQAGIVIRRTNQAQHPATNITVDSNHVGADGCLAAGAPAPLDYGGVFFSGLHDTVRVASNEITNVGPRAMYFYSVNITQANVTHNTWIGGTRIITGSMTGILGPNTYVPCDRHPRSTRRR